MFKQGKKPRKKLRPLEVPSESEGSVEESFVAE